MGEWEYEYGNGEIHSQIVYEHTCLYWACDQRAGNDVCMCMCVDSQNIHVYMYMYMYIKYM